jgi:hypothetical protein
MSKATRYHAGRQTAKIAGVVSTLVLLGACASAPIEPVSSLDAARAAITNAEKLDANQYAAAELDVARQKLLLANRSVSDNSTSSMIIADRLAKEARIEAELAAARTESKKAAEVNRELMRGADALTEEMKRAGEQK